MEIDRDGLEVLDRAECLRLLGTAAVGRIAGTFGALPVVLPLRYEFDGDSIVFEMEPGSTLDFVSTGSVVAFEVDNLHQRGHASWTVMVTGVARRADDGSVRLDPALVSGRRTHRTRHHARSRAGERGRLAQPA